MSNDNGVDASRLEISVYPNGAFEAWCLVERKHGNVIWQSEETFDTIEEAYECVIAIARNQIKQLKEENMRLRELLEPSETRRI